MSVPSKIHRSVLAIGGWYWLVGVGGFLWALLSWVSSHLAPIAQLGWAADVLSGVLFSSLLMASSGVLLYGWRSYKSLQPPIPLVGGNVEYTANTQTNALEIRFEETEQYMEVNQLEGGTVQRVFYFRVYNLGNGFLTDTVVLLKNTAPEMPERAVKLMASAQTLSLGQYRTVKLAHYSEVVPDPPLTPDTIVLGWYHGGGLMYGTVPAFRRTKKNAPLVVEIEAKARECAPCRAMFRIWVDDEDRRLRAQKF